jgi:hypothetical protein
MNPIDLKKPLLPQLTQAVITNKDGQLQSVSGDKAVDAFRIRVIISGLKLESKGMRMSRGLSALKTAKSLTGLKTRDYAKQIERLELLLAQRVSECTVVTDGEIE